MLIEVYNDEAVPAQHADVATVGDVRFDGRIMTRIGFGLPALLKGLLLAFPQQDVSLAGVPEIAWDWLNLSHSITPSCS